MIATRMAFGNELLELAKTQENFMICNPDTKSCNLEHFDEFFPGRSFTFGIAEQNLVAAAAGMASCGVKVYVPTFSVFLTLRACEQIRTFVCYPKLNVTLLGTHSGLQVGQDGGTHICCEDVGVMRSLANMTIVQPSDAVSARAVARWSVGFDGPLYIRLHRSPVEEVHAEPYEFHFGKAELLRDYGRDVTLITTGVMLPRTLHAAQMLRTLGIGAKVLEVHTIKPIDSQTIVETAGSTRGVVTVEDHSIYGGLGSAVSEVLSQHCPVPMRFIGVQDAFGESAKDPETLYAAHHMTVDDIVRAAKELLA